MSTMNITFKHPDEIIDFLKTVCKFDFNMDMRRGRAVVDAKSLLGIMNLGLNCRCMQTIAQNLKDS